MTSPRNKRRALGRAAAILAVCFLAAGCVSNENKEDDQANAGGADASLELEGDTSSANELSDAGIVNEDLTDPGAKLSDASANEPPPPVEATLSEPTVADEPSSGSSGSAGSSSNAGNGQEVTITDIRYVSKKDGGTVVIETSGPATYHTRDVAEQNQMVVEISNAKLPSRLKRPYITKDFKQAIDGINAYQDKGSSTARVVIQFKHAAQTAVVQSGKTLTIAANDSAPEDNPSKASSTENQAANASAGESPEDLPDMASAESPNAAEGGEAEFGAKAKSPTPHVDAPAGEATMFYGRPISLEFSNTPVREVISMIAEQSGSNIMISGEKEFDEPISLKLKQIPWDQALMLVLKTKGLGYIRTGSVLRISTNMAMQKETDDLKKIAEAQKAAEPLRVKVIAVNYAKVDDLEKKIKPFLSPRGQVAGDIRTSSIIITDIAENLDRASNLVRSIDSAPLQVLIEGKVVEARSSFLRNVGVNWNYTGVPIGSGALQLTHTGSTITPFGTTYGNLNLTLGTLDILGNIGATLALAEIDNQVRIVSSPRIMAMNNEPAVINQTSNIPIPKTTFAPGGALPIQTVDYKAIQLNLEVTPQITSGSDVIMAIKIKREFTVGDSTTPSVESRDAQTKILVKNGQTAVIGGVYQSDATQNEQGIPYLRSIPILGWLFKNRSVKNDKNELMLFLTPRILNRETEKLKEAKL